MKVAIIGAGAAGLSAAHYLQQLRQIRATVFEAGDRVGGKCCTEMHGGEPYDLGAVLVASGYRCIIDLAQRFEVKLDAGPPHVLIDTRTGVRRPLAHGVLDLKSPEILAASGRLARLLFRERGLMRPGFEGLGAELELPIAEYFRRHRLEPLAASLLPIFTGYGYGFARDVPAAYLFKLLLVFFPQSMASLRRWVMAKQAAGVRLLEGLEGMVPRGGYQALWERVAAGIDVRLDCRVTAIERHEDHIIIRAAGRAEWFDKVILAIDPSEVAAVLDCSGAERSVLAKVRFVTYCSLLCEVDRRAPAQALFLGHHSTAGLPGRLLALSRPSAQRAVCIAYLIVGEHQSDVDLNLVVRDAEAVGERVRRIVAERRWKYFPHLSANDLRSFYSDIEARQGARNAFFAGEVMSFSSVEHVCQYSRSLVERFF
jgi:phytoene dehydrogenase-like protein